MNKEEIKIEENTTVVEEKVEKESGNKNSLLYAGALGALILGAAFYFLRKKK